MSNKKPPNSNHIKKPDTQKTHFTINKTNSMACLRRKLCCQIHFKFKQFSLVTREVNSKNSFCHFLDTTMSIALKNKKFAYLHLAGMGCGEQSLDCRLAYLSWFTLTQSFSHEATRILLCIQSTNDLKNQIENSLFIFICNYKFFH